MFPVRCDVAKEEDILSMFAFIKKKFGILHVCVNNAGLATLDTLISGKTEVSNISPPIGNPAENRTSYMVLKF